MKPYKSINNVKKIVEDMTFELTYSKDKVKDAERINSIIDCLNEFESILEVKYKVSGVDNLLCYIFNDFMLGQETTPEKEIQLPYIIDKIDFHLKNSATDNMLFLAQSIRTYEFMRKYRIKDEKGCEKLAKETTDKDIVKLLKNLFNEFKERMIWRK